MNWECGVVNWWNENEEEIGWIRGLTRGKTRWRMVDRV
jgi:hypothetical protein